jgi:ABC-type Na+ efflux pump permease subunit
MPDPDVLIPNATSNVSDAVEVAKDSTDKEKVAIDALHNVLSEVMNALKKIGEDVDNINKRVSTLEKSISVKVVDDKITVDGKKDEMPKLGEYKTDTVEFAKSNIPASGGNVVTNPDVQIIKSILTANKTLDASEIYYLVKKNIKPKVI